MLIDELVGASLPADLQPRQAELQAITRTIFQDGIGWLLTQYASRSASSARPNSTSSDSGFGSDTALRNRESLTAGETSALPETSTNWNSQLFPQDLGVGPEVNNVTTFDGFDMNGDWRFDVPWPGSRQEYGSGGNEL